MASVYKTGILYFSCLYIQALLILTNSSTSKNQVVHEQKFKDPLSSAFQISSERRVLDLESDVPSPILTGRGVTFGFCIVKTDAKIGIIANVVCL